MKVHRKSRLANLDLLAEKDPKKLIRIEDTTPSKKKDTNSKLQISTRSSRRKASGPVKYQPSEKPGRVRLLLLFWL